jgi:hypothetical protein
MSVPTESPECKGPRIVIIGAGYVLLLPPLLRTAYIWIGWVGSRSQLPSSDSLDTRILRSVIIVRIVWTSEINANSKIFEKAESVGGTWRVSIIAVIPHVASDLTCD